MKIAVIGAAGMVGSRVVTEAPRVLDDNRYAPTHIRPIAAAGVHQLDVCRAHPADWVYLSPPALLEPGERTGTDRHFTVACGDPG